MSMEAIALSKRGKIRSVHCKQFVTYDDCVFYPCEYLNVVIGPNGSGKSTLVAGIVLGLGGEPKLLARASSIAGYIKNGCTHATVSVELYKDEGHVTKFKRTFNQSGKSDYSVDDRAVTHKAYLEAVDTFRVQVSNLCSFLPQDKVQDFTKMKPQEIFVNTINSICEQDVIEDYAKLKELQAYREQVYANKSKLVQKIAQASHRISELRAQLEQFQHQKSMQDHLNVCNAKKLRLEIQNIQLQIEECNNDLHLAKQNLATYEKECQKFERKQSEVDQVKNEMTQECRQNDQCLSAADKQVGQITEKINTLRQRLQSKEAEVQDKERAATEKHHELENGIILLQLYKQDLDNLLPEESPQSSPEERLRECEKRLEKIKHEISDLSRRHREIQSNIDEYCAELQSLKQRKEELENVHKRKKEFLRSSYPDVYKAITWLDGNADLFQGKIYRPVILELNVLNHNHAKYLENTINVRDLLAFSCESESDLSLLVSELCVKQKLLVNVFHAPSSNAAEFKPKVPIESLRSFGFESYLVDSVTGPPAIMGYLCKIYNLHNIPHGNGQVNQNTDFIPQEIRIFFGGTMRYERSVSKYGNRVASLMKTTINSKKLLTCSDDTKIAELERSQQDMCRQTDTLKNNRSALEAQIREKEDKYKDELAVKKTILNQQTELTNKIKQVQRQREKIDALKTEIDVLPNVKEAFKAYALDAVAEMVQLQKQKVDALLDLQRLTNKKAYLRTKMLVFTRENDELIKHVRQLKTQKEEKKKLLSNIGIKCENLKRDMKNKLKESLRLTGEIDPMEESYPYRSFYAELPNTIDEIKDKIRDLRARLDCVDDVNPEVVSEYEAKRELAESLENEAEQNKRSDEDTGAEIQTIYSRWYPKVADVVSTISRHFSTFMESMSYVGEVQLINKEEHDFESYGIEIWVQYRHNIPLQVLNRHVQSGGERAVAIAVYTLSMQHLINVPFRCVDEINQGMDALNEKKIFEMLVNETTKEGKAQYFFVTPKLLPNLQSNDRMMVHVVFNSKMVESSTVF